MPVLSTLGAAIANVYGFTSGLIKDQYFNLVSLLLPGNGTNGAQNNTFLDSGTANSGSGFTITRNGNTTQGTFSPFSQTGWGNYFDGSSDSITAPNSCATLGAPSGNTNDFTIEGFFFPTGTGINWSFGTVYSTVNYWAFSFNRNMTTGANAVGRVAFALTDNFVLETADSKLIANQWNHVAAVRTGTTVSLYVNGVREATNTSSVDPNPTGVLQIGRDSGLGRDYLGYVSNARIVRGSTQPYSASSSTITVPTASLTAVSGTSLLTCQSNRFRDASSSGLTITVNGNPSVTPFSPFAPTQSYSASAVGGSGYFDGTGDYLSVANNAALSYGTGSFTIEGFFYTSATTQYGAIFSDEQSSGTFGLTLLMNPTVGNGQLVLYGNGSLLVTATGKYNDNAWHHFAISRDSTNLRLYVDGAYIGASASGATNFDASQPLLLMTSPIAGRTISGYLSNFRAIKGTALYTGTSTITVPTAPLTNITNTSLLLNFTNAGVVDATAKNVLETVGNAQISNGAGGGKWGGGSINFASASNSNLLGNTPSNWTYLHDGSSWTVEFWLYPTDVSSFQGLICTNRAGSSYIGLGIAINSSAITLSFTRGVSGSSASFTSSAVLNANQWNYVGITFTNSTKTCAFFINGASAGSSSNTGFSYSSSAPSNPPYIGQTGDSSFPYYFNGYIDDLRITRGIARTITANPTAPFPVQ